MRHFAPSVFALLMLIDPAVGAPVQIGLIDAEDACRYLVPSVENGGDLLGDSWRGIAVPSNDSQWSDGQVGIGFDTGGLQPYYELVQHDVSAEMYQKNASLFVRVPFELDADTIESIAFLYLQMRYDDGFVAWVNGVEVARSHAPATADLTWQSEATEVRPVSQVPRPVQFDLYAAQSVLREGVNYLTVHALNRSALNQDFLMLPELFGYTEEIMLFEQSDLCEVLVPSVENGGAALGDTWKGIDLPENYFQWLQGLLGVGYSSDINDDYHHFIGTDTFVEMRYNVASAFVRVPFEIRDLDELALIRSLWLRMRFEDGFVVWLNGEKVMQFNAPEQLAWDSSATASHPDSQALIPADFDISDHVGKLVVGTNVMAFQGLNSSVVSADFLLSPELVGDSRPPSVFRDAAHMTTRGIEYIPDYGGGLPALDVTYGVATGRQYVFESSKDLINWKREAKFLAQPQDEFRRTLRARIGFRVPRVYCRLRELPLGD